MNVMEEAGIQETYLQSRDQTFYGVPLVVVQEELCEPIRRTVQEGRDEFSHLEEGGEHVVRRVPPRSNIAGKGAVVEGRGRNMSSPLGQ